MQSQRDEFRLPFSVFGEISESQAAQQLLPHNVSVVRNDNYWGGKVMCAGIDFHVLADASTLNFALQNGELDGGYAVDVEFINNYVNDPAFIAQISSSTRTSFGFMNQNPGHVLQDEVLRQAVIRLMDREGVCHSLLYDQYIPGITPLTSALPYGYDELNDINGICGGSPMRGITSRRSLK